MIKLVVLYAERRASGSRSRKGRTTMLKGIDRAISAELLLVLMSMGHGDDLLICDVNHPAATHRQTHDPRPARQHGGLRIAARRRGHPVADAARHVRVGAGVSDEGRGRSRTGDANPRAHASRHRPGGRTSGADGGFGGASTSTRRRGVPMQWSGPRTPAPTGVSSCARASSSSRLLEHDQLDHAHLVV